MMPHIFVLRHGRSLANEEGRIASRIENAGDAYGLTPLGCEQVHGSVQGAVDAGSLAPPVLLVSSPLLRARESAQVAGEVLGVSPSVDARLIERGFGDLELGPDRAYAEVWEADLRDPTHRNLGVESVADVLRRAGGVVEDLAEKPDVGTVVLCTHGDVASTLLCASVGAPLGRHREVGALATGALQELPSVAKVLEARVALGRGRAPH
jgi:probable phosphoglycerate mutase